MSPQYSNMKNLSSYEFVPYYEGFKGQVSKLKIISFNKGFMKD